MSRTLNARKKIATITSQKMRGEGERGLRARRGSAAKRVPVKGDGGPTGIGPATAHAGELIDLGKEMAAILPLKRPDPTRPTVAKAETSKIVKSQRKGQPAAADHNADSKPEGTAMCAGMQDGVALVGVVDWLARQLLSSAAFVFTALDASSKGREQIDYRHEGAAGEWRLFAKAPGGLLNMRSLSGGREHHRCELSLPCLKSSLRVVGESLARQVARTGLRDPGIELFVAAAEEVASSIVSAAEADAVLTVVFETSALELVATFASAASALKIEGDLQIIKGMVEDLVLVRNPERAVVAMRWKRGSSQAEEALAPPAVSSDANLNSLETRREGNQGVIVDDAMGIEGGSGAKGALAELDRIGHDTVVVTVTTDKLDLQAAPMLGARLMPLIEDQRVKLLIVDLGQVKVIGSSCLGILIRTRSAHAAFGRRLALVALNDSVRQILEAAGLLSSFEVGESLKDVISSRITLVEEPVPVPARSGHGGMSRVKGYAAWLATLFGMERSWD